MKLRHYSLDGIKVVAVGRETVLKAQKRVKGCLSCSGSASRPFRSILAEGFANDPSVEYLFCFPASCPACSSPIFEQTLVDIADDSSLARQIATFGTQDVDNKILFIDKPTLNEAKSFIAACEHCSDIAEIPFDQLLDEVTGSDPRTTEYVICHPASCPNCHCDVMEKTLIVPI